MSENHTAKCRSTILVITNLNELTNKSLKNSTWMIFFVQLIAKINPTIYSLLHPHWFLVHYTSSFEIMYKFLHLMTLFSFLHSSCLKYLHFPALLIAVCDPKSLLFLFGMQLDYSDALIGGGFSFKNPNATQTCGCGKSFAAEMWNTYCFILDNPSIEHVVSSCVKRKLWKW